MRKPLQLGIERGRCESGGFRSVIVGIHNGIAIGQTGENLYIFAIGNTGGHFHRRFQNLCLGIIAGVDQNMSAIVYQCSYGDGAFWSNLGGFFCYIQSWSGCCSVVLKLQRLIKVGGWPPISSTSPKSPWKGT